MNIEKVISDLSIQLNEYHEKHKIIGKSFERPLKSIIDGYPEITISWLSKSINNILTFWFKLNSIEIPSEPNQEDLLNTFKTKETNLNKVSNLIELKSKLDNLQKEFDISNDIAITLLKQFIQILDWLANYPPYTNKVELNNELKEKIIFLIEFYNVFKLKLIHIYIVQKETVYLLFEKKLGIKYEYLEIIVSEKTKVLERFLHEKEKLLKTQYPIKSSFVIADHIKRNHKLPASITSIDNLLKSFINWNKYKDLRFSGEFKPFEYVDLDGQLLAYNGEKQDFEIDNIDNLSSLIDDYIEVDEGNLFIISKPGGGKTSICKNIVNLTTSKSNDKYALFFDLSVMEANEPIENFITRSCQDIFNINTHEIFELVSFLNNNGKLILVFDSFDEMFGKIELDKMLSVFSEISKLFTPKSKIVITSRQSFFMSSKYMRELLDSNAVVSDKVSYGLNNVGIDPLQLPNFKILNLNSIQITNEDCSFKHKKILKKLDFSSRVELTPLQYQLTGILKSEEAISCLNKDKSRFSTAKLLMFYFEKVFSLPFSSTIVKEFVKYFYESFQKHKTIFNIVNIFSYFGEELFPENIPTYENMIGKELFIKLNDFEIKFRHKNFYEFIFSIGYSSNFKVLDSEFSITDEIRKFIYEINISGAFFKVSNKNQIEKLIIPKQSFIVGDYDNVKIKKLTKNIIFDEFTVQVFEYNIFLKEARKHNINEFLHPLHPTNLGVEPMYHRLKDKDYYIKEEYKNFPAVCIDWWSAYAYARFVGKRLPTSFEWECAARGFYGNLFPWGNTVDINYANSADFWAGELLITYDKWKAHFDKSGTMYGGEAQNVNTFPKNVSPFGIRNMSGNIWEYTASTTKDLDKVIICGGSYDNPFRAIKCSSKGVANLDTYSGVVGFRCCKNL